MWHTVDEASGGGGGSWGGGGVRKRLSRRHAAEGIYEYTRRRRWRWRRRKGGEEEEGQLWRRRGVSGGGGKAADHGRRAIRDPAPGAYDLLVGRSEATVLCSARRSGGGCLPRQEVNSLRAGQAGGGGRHRSGAVNMLN